MPQPTTNARIEELKARLGADATSRHFYPLAEELRKVGRLEEAEQILREGLTKHSTYVSAWVSLGRVLKDQSKWHEAVDVLRRASTLDPGNVVTERLLGESHLALGDKLEALKKLKLVYALMPSDQALEAQITALDREVNGTAEAPDQMETPVAAQPGEPSEEPPFVIAAEAEATEEATQSTEELLSPEAASAAPSVPETSAESEEEHPAEQTHELWRPAPFAAPPRLVTTEEPFSEAAQLADEESATSLADDVFGEDVAITPSAVFDDEPAPAGGLAATAAEDSQPFAVAEQFEDSEPIELSSPSESPSAQEPSARQRKVERLNRWLSSVRGAGHRV